MGTKQGSSAPRQQAKPVSDATTALRCPICAILKCKVTRDGGSSRMPDTPGLSHYFAAMKAVLEVLFEPQWFENPRNHRHPAWVQWALCKQNIQNRGRNRLADPDVRHHTSRLVLDTITWITL